MKCSCGNHTENINSFFHKESQLRVTVCDKCAEANGLTNKDKYIRIPHKELTSAQNKTPEPNAITNNK